MRSISTVHSSDLRHDVVSPLLLSHQLLFLAEDAHEPACSRALTHLLRFAAHIV